MEVHTLAARRLAGHVLGVDVRAIAHRAVLGDQVPAADAADRRDRRQSVAKDYRLKNHLPGAPRTSITRHSRGALRENRSNGGFNRSRIQNMARPGGVAMNASQSSCSGSIYASSLHGCRTPALFIARWIRSRVGGRNGHSCPPSET